MTNLINSINSVNNVSKINTTNTEDVKKLVKYVNGELLKDKPDTFVSTTKSAVGFASVFEGIPLLRFLARKGLIKKNAEKIANGGFVDSAMNQLKNTKKEALNNLLHGSDKLTTRIKTYVKSSGDSIDAYKSIRSAASAQSKQIKALKKGTDAFVKATEKAEKAVQGANESIGKIGKTLENKSDGLSKFITDKFPKLTQKTGNLAKTVTTKFPKLGKFSKLLKTSGAGAMLIFSGVSETATEIVPTFKELGFKKGIKQVAKSAIKVAGDTAGYVLGAKAGAAIGTAICPGAGTAVGAVLGLVGGLLGSFFMGKVTKKITGKTEREKAKEAEEQKQAELIVKNKGSIDEVKELAAQKIAAEYEETGTLSEDSQIALEAFNNLEQTNPFVA